MTDSNEFVELRRVWESAATSDNFNNFIEAHGFKSISYMQQLFVSILSGKLPPNSEELQTLRVSLYSWFQPDTDATLRFTELQTAIQNLYSYPKQQCKIRLDYQFIRIHLVQLNDSIGVDNYNVVIIPAIVDTEQKLVAKGCYFTMSKHEFHKWITIRVLCRVRHLT